MKKMKNKIVQLGQAILLFVLIFQLAAVPVSAAPVLSATTETDVDLEPGIIEITSVPSLSYYGILPKPGRHDSLSKRIQGEVKGSFVVEDGRATDAGWTVKVNLSEFKLQGDPKYWTLVMADLSLGAPTLRPLESTGEAFTGYPTVLRAGDGIYHTMAIAPRGTAGGSWEGTIGETSLLVKTGSRYFGEHQAVLHWSVEDTP